MIYLESMEIGETMATCTKGVMNYVHTVTKVSSNQYKVTVSCTNESFTVTDGLVTVVTWITAERAVYRFWNLLKGSVQKE